MKLKNKDIYASLKVLLTICETKLEAPIAYKMLKKRKELLDKTEVYIKIREEKLKEYGALSEDGQNYEIKKEDADAFIKEMEPLDNEEIEIENFSISITDLKDVKMTAFEIQIIKWMLKDE